MLPKFTFTVLLLSILSLNDLGSSIYAQAGSADALKLSSGFQGELIYSVPDEQGSWVAMTHDPQGRLITSDQHGKLYRITPAQDENPLVGPIDLEIGFAQGLLCAFDSLYVVSYGIETSNRPPGLYRIRDTNDDDHYDRVELLREFVGKSEHGPHAVVLGPDKKSLYVCAGNHTKLPNLDVSRVPRHWQEDQVLTRLPDPGGHAVGRMAPAGWVCKTDPDGKAFELCAIGFRNEYDIAFDPNGELFTYDADMEWDVGLPWYRPTRICHVVSGSDFGWRYGSGKWPDYYPDSVPAVHDVGPGSPTGVTFGTGAGFPAKYQRALFAADWSYGTIYAVHLQADGSTYQATKERFCSAPALPITDLLINSVDKAMYFLIGGRRCQSGLYRITYVGDESTAPATYPAMDPAVELRRRLEAAHVVGAKPDLDFAWEQLASRDRMIRYVARIAVEHQPVAAWAERAIHETDPTRALESITALIRCGDQRRQADVIAALDRLDWQALSGQQRLHLLRNYGLALCRLGEPTDATKATIQKLAAFLPTHEETIDRELSKLLIAVETPGVTQLAVKFLLAPSAQESQIAYAHMLSDAKVGWSQSLREKYFQWFLDIAKTKGGHSYGGYLSSIKKHAVAGLTPREQNACAEVLSKEPDVFDPYAGLKSRPFVQKWTLDALLPSDDSAFVNRDLENGKQMFALANCYSCHRISREGGRVGPELTTAGHRFNTKDLLEAIVSPSKSISDQYEATLFQMDDGRVITGRVANLSGENYLVQKDMIDPGNLTKVKAVEIEAMMRSEISMMPTGLLDNLTHGEILDLLAYLKSTAKQE